MDTSLTQFQIHHDPTNEDASKGKSGLKEVDNCPHDTMYEGICVLCFQDVSNLMQTFDGYVSHCHPQIYVSPREAMRIDWEKTQLLLDHEKLALVLDLDNTLVHTVTEDSLKDVEEAVLVEGDILVTLEEALERSSSGINLEDTIIEFVPTVSAKKHFVKFRPGVFDFIEEASQLFDLYIYTMGTKAYASTIAKLLDEKGTIFTNDKVLARDDCPNSTSKSLQRIFPCDDSMVLIIDDREDVWMNSSGEVCPNLIKIEPYHYFGASMRNAKKDNYLEKFSKIVKSVHIDFYSNNPESNSVKHLLYSAKKQVFEDCVFALNGMQRPQIAQVTDLCESFGATVVSGFNDTVTHIITSKEPNLKKQTSEALADSNIHLVSLDWVLNSTKRWKREREHKYSYNRSRKVNDSGSDSDVSYLRKRKRDESEDELDELMEELTQFNQSSSNQS